MSDPGSLPTAPPSGPAVELPPPPKARFYRRWWFWVLVVPGVLFVIVSWGSADDTQTEAAAGPAASAEPASLIGGSLRAAIDVALAAGTPEDDILVVDSVTTLSSDSSVYESRGFGIGDLGSDEFIESQVVCGIQQGQAARPDAVVIWAESSCDEGAARLEALLAPASAASAAASEPASEATSEPTTEPSASPSGPTPMFASRAAGDLLDMAKDLDDMAVALAEGGVLRLMGNTLELSFNVGQLESLVPPDGIAQEWNRGLADLSGAVDGLSDAVAADSTDRQVSRAMDKVVSAVTDLAGIVDSSAS